MIPVAPWNTGQTFPCVLINNIEPANLSLVTQLVFNKIIAPDMVFMFRSKPKAATIIQPKSSALWLFLWDFKPLFSPYPLDTLMVDLPTLRM